MIDFNLCRKCPQGCFQPAVMDDEEETRIKASVKCELADADLLFMNSKPPSSCPFALEHKLVTQDIPMSFANYMSGHRRKCETDF